MTIVRILAWASLAVALFAAPGLGQTGGGADEAAVRAALQNYLLAHATGDGTYKERVFHAVADLYFLRDGELRSMTSEEYVARSPGEPADDESERGRWIESVDVTGDAAVAKIVLDYPGVRITDYMALLEIDGAWKIVNKIVHAERR